MADTHIEVCIEELPEDTELVVTCTLARALRIRLWVARVLMGLAARVLGVPLSVEIRSPTHTGCACNTTRNCEEACSCSQEA